MAMIEVAGALLILALFVIGLIYVIISGLLEPLTVKTRENYRCRGFYAYKVYIDDYSNAGTYFTEVSTIRPELECVSIYYDDPKRVPKEQCRFTVGALIGDNVDVQKREKLFSVFRSHGYKIKEIDNIGRTVYCSFPYVTSLSILLAVARVYPEMSAYILEHRLDARLFMEHYAGNFIHFIAPLERHDDLMMPGVPDLLKVSAVEPVPPFDLPKLDEPTEPRSARRQDEDSISSASSFEEVNQDDCLSDAAAPAQL